MGAQCSVWFNAVVRGDVNSIRIGDRCNIQDAAVIHCTYQKAATTLGNDVSIGHGAIVHGCTVEDRVLIGMGAKVLDHAHIEPDVLLGAGALVPPGMRLESGYLYTGLPAQKRRLLTEEERELIQRTAQNYILYAGWFAGV
jgi:carbonic anhydrase/acetyltransferase-like protein (isoleucine patch superfamily)